MCIKGLGLVLNKSDESKAGFDVLVSYQYLVHVTLMHVFYHLYGIVLRLLFEPSHVK